MFEVLREFVVGAEHSYGAEQEDPRHVRRTMRRVADWRVVASWRGEGLAYAQSRGLGRVTVDCGLVAGLDVGDGE